MDVHSLSKQEKNLINRISIETAEKNIDNITRTEAYFEYFKQHPEIIWSMLASMVSRNGGYNMCDLQGEIFSRLLDPRTRKQLFLTYERANWLIFHDVFPQLLLYHYSTKLKRPMFHLMPFFNISVFIQKEWKRFWHNNDQNRLMISLIINEQNVIQAPIIEHPIYRSKVFRSSIFYIQDLLHFSCVILPTCGGELYGASVNGFRKLGKRIDLGKRLASVLFHHRLFPYFYEFAENTPHTGSRYDYERYFKTGWKRTTPFLRTSFPVIHHHRHEYNDWSKFRYIPFHWLHSSVHHRHTIHLTDWYMQKRNQLYLLVAAKQNLNPNKGWM